MTVGLMSIRTSRLAVMTFVVLATSLSATAASASNWSTTLNSSSAGQARSSATATAPTGVTATCTASNQKTVVVSWVAVSHAKYSVYQSSTSSSTGFTVVASGVATTSWTSASLPTGLTYWYKVSATIGSNWTSSMSTASTGRLIKSTSPNCS
jgi:hypothetical protein